MRHRPARPSETAPPVVLIAGASSGIGLQTALCYAERGARLVLAARSLGALQDAEDQCLQAGAAATLVVVTDVVEPARVDTMLEEAVARFGQIDVAVGCVGVAAFGRFEDVPADVFEAVVRTNWLSAHPAGYLRPHRGSWLSVCSERSSSSVVSWRRRRALSNQGW